MRFFNYGSLIVNTTKLVVTESALIARAKRVLVAEGKTIKKFRPGSAEISRIGAFCLVDNSGGVLKGFNDLAEVARDLGILKPYEELTV